MGFSQDRQFEINLPEYFLVVVLDAVRVGVGRESGLLRFKDRFRVTVLDCFGTPLSNKEFALYLPDGTRKSVKTDDQGCIKGRVKARICTRARPGS